MKNYKRKEDVEKRGWEDRKKELGVGCGYTGSWVAWSLQGSSD